MTEEQSTNDPVILALLKCKDETNLNLHDLATKVKNLTEQLRGVEALVIGDIERILANYVASKKIMEEIGDGIVQSTNTLSRFISPAMNEPNNNA